MGNNEAGVTTDNLAIGAVVQKGRINTYGAISGRNNTGTMTNNYYINCTVDGVENAIEVGCGNADITDNDGAVPGNKIILADHVTSDATIFTIPTLDELEEQTFSVAAFGATVTLGYELSGYEVTYYVDEEPIEGNTFTMPNAYIEAVVVDATVIPVVTLDIAGYGTGDGGYYLIATPFESVDPADVEGMTDGSFDLYRFNQAADLEWENWKQEGDNYHFNLASGRGYLYAHQTDVTLVFTGEPYSGNGEVTLSKNTGVDFEGWNFVGNPFNETAYIADGRAFYTMNGEGSEIMAAEVDDIAPMEGVFVIAAEDGETMTFTTEASGNGKGLALNLSHGRGVIDRAIVRFGDGGMLPKFQMRSNSTKVYIPQDNMDYAVVNVGRDGACTVSTEIPVNFKAQENGTYTLSVSESLNSQFSILHLIDNLTGNEIDLLQTPSYSFEAKTTDYESRFKLVFASGEAEDETFAFISNGSIVVNGEGTLQVIDMLGRTIATRRDGACTVSTNGMTPGVYVLRLVNGDDVKTQKMVIE